MFSYVLALIVRAVAPLPSLLHQSLSEWAQGRTGVLQYTLYADHLYRVVLKKVTDSEKRSFLQVELLNYRQFRSGKISQSLSALFPLKISSGCSGPFAAEFQASSWIPLRAACSCIQTLFFYSVKNKSKNSYYVIRFSFAAVCDCYLSFCHCASVRKLLLH